MLLHDAMHPHRPVPAGAAPGSLRSASRGQAAAPQPSQRLLDELAQRAAKLRAEEEAAARKAAEAAVAAGAAETGQIGGGSGGGGGGGAPAALPAAGAVQADAEAMEVESDDPTGSATAGAAAAPAAATAAAGATTAGDGRMLAGERALLLLPACYSLLESCVGAVAADAAAGDDEDDGGGDAMERDEPAELRRAQPELSEAVLRVSVSGVEWGPNQRQIGTGGRSKRACQDDRAWPGKACRAPKEQCVGGARADLGQTLRLADPLCPLLSLLSASPPPHSTRCAPSTRSRRRC